MAKRTKTRRTTRYLLPMTIRRVENGRYLGRSRVLPGLNVEADSIEDVLRLAPGVARALLAAMRDKGVTMPKSLEGVRAPANVHMVIAA